MAYKVVNGKIVSTKKSQKLGGAALGFQVDDQTRRIYMVRMRIDQQGRAFEENRTTFHVPTWLDMTVTEWESFKTKWFADTNQLFDKHKFEGLHSVNNPVTLTVY